MGQIAWYVVQGGIIAGLYTFLRGACPDCAPVAAGVLATIAALIVTVTVVGLYESAVAVRNFIHSRRAKQGLNERPVVGLGRTLSKGSPRPDHLTKFRHLPPH